MSIVCQGSNLAISNNPGNASNTVQTVVIMPIFGQSSYFGEALSSVIAQETTVDFRIILIDDCCQDPSTVREARKAARSYPDKVLYIRSAHNAGLSSVRNTGVDYSLEQWPDLYSILFFDGDDRMHRKLIERSVCALREETRAGTSADQGANGSSDRKRLVGWVFEDPDHFGMDGLVLRVHKYSALFSMTGCANTSSSMMLADMFRMGLRYSESMLGGSEDWNFWLDALKHGYRGCFKPHLGFQYRRRPGSMAYHALKAADKNRASIRGEHSELYSPDFYLKEESQECPRYAVFSADVIPHGIDEDRQLVFPTVDELVRSIVEYEKVPTNPISPYVIYSTANCLGDLHRERVLDWCLWRMEAQAGQSNLVCSRFSDVELEKVHVSVDNDRAYSTQARNGEIFCVSIERILELIRTQKSLSQCTSYDWYRGSNYKLSKVSGRPVFSEFESFITQVGLKYKHLRSTTAQRQFTKWVPFGIDRPKMGEHLFDATPLLPIQGSEDSVLCIVRSSQLSLDSKASETLIRIVELLKENGQEVSLLVLGGEADHHITRHFDRLLLCRDRSVNGKMVPELGIKRLLGLLLPFSNVLTFGTTEYAADLNQLRRYRRGIYHVYSKNTSSLDIPNTDLLNCFKVYSKVLCTSSADATRVAALGVSSEQIVTTVGALMNDIGVKESTDAAPVF